MAITFIYSVKATGNKSLDYSTEDKTGKVKKVKNDSKDSLEYVIRDKRGNVYNLSDAYLEKMKKYIYKDNEGNIVFKTIQNTLNCSSENTYQEWEHIRKVMNPSKGSSGNLQYCIVQNFGTDVDPEIANEIGMKFAQEYLDRYQVVVSTHINTGYVHNHIEFNATSFLDGKKFNDQRKTIGEIRKISDKFCKEYELEVLEKTQEFNYVIYKDENGKTKIFEPTERKLNLSENEFSNNDYRNSIAYSNSKKYSEMPHYKIVQHDMNNAIKISQNYEEMLQNLRNMGYIINDKTKNGEWRKRISFKLPEWDKPVRDTSLEEKYLRVNLNKYFENHQAEKESNDIGINDFVDDEEIYQYGRMIIEELNEKYRYETDENNEVRKVDRSELEKMLIKNTKKVNREINEIVSQAVHPERERIQTLENGTKKQQYYIDIINNNLKTLKFVEDNNLQSFKQISEKVSVLYDKRNKCYVQLKKMSEMMKKASVVQEAVSQYLALHDNIEKNSDNPDYQLYEMANDEMLLKEYSSILKKYNLNSYEEILGYNQRFKEYRENFTIISKQLEDTNKNIMAYDSCINNISRVDKEYSNIYSEQIEEYFREKENHRRNDKER